MLLFLWPMYQVLITTQPLAVLLQSAIALRCCHTVSTLVTCFTLKSLTAHFEFDMHHCKL